VSIPTITFLSDYGLKDDFVGVCHAVILSICQAARVIDLTHGIPRQDIRAGALSLSGALPYTPVGVHLAVVDPGVGAHRRAIALKSADQRILVGPDNGLLSLAAASCGGVVEAVEISDSRFRLEPVAATFHGRDVFAPVAAHLARGTPLADVGRPCDPSTLVGLSLPAARVEPDGVTAHALYIDTFGNVALDASHDQLVRSGLKLGAPVEIEAPGGERHPGVYARTFADVPAAALLVYQDSYRRLAVAVSHGDAAARLGVGIDDELRIRPK
jgi:S-adenosylmethionine hydrolase